MKQSVKQSTRRRRSDSIAAAVAATQAAALGPLEPPPHVTLRDRDRPFWNAIMQARARDTWNTADLAHAANLARTQADIERLQAEVDAEGDVTFNAAGSPVLNPKHKLLETLSRRAVAVARMLHVHAEATVGKSEDASKALANERAARDDADDDLIPGLRAIK